MVIILSQGKVRWPRDEAFVVALMPCIICDDICEAYLAVTISSNVRPINVYTKY